MKSTSVIIPVYNMAEQLKLCIAALLENGLTGPEILVVDDWSTDDVRSAAQPARTIKTSHRGGPGPARNEGLRHTDRPYILFLDADVVLPPDALAHIGQTFDERANDKDVVAVMGVYSEDSSRCSGFLTDFKNLNVAYLQSTTPNVSPYVHSAIFCVKREALESVGGFDSRVQTAEDFRLGMTFGVKGYRSVIDRRVKGRHLKQYSLKSVLKEDYRRIRDLQSVPLAAEERAFFYRANRWSRVLSVIVPVPTVLIAAAAIVWPVFGLASLALFAIFAALNAGFIRYCVAHRGSWFAAKALAFLFVEMTWAQLCLAAVTISRALRLTMPSRNS
jgi:GT2 family glycosyltransferase